MKSLKIWILLWLAAVCLSCFIRLYPLRAHLWDNTYDQASLMVVYKIKSTLIEQVRAQLPQAPPAVVDQIASKKLNETLRQNNKQFHETIAKVNQQLFASSGQRANIYLLESDPYYYYYLTANIIEKGRMADEIRGSKYLDPLMAAPFGFWQPLSYHPYVGAWIYRFCRLFNPDISLMAAVAYTPLVLMALVLAAFFWLCACLRIRASAAFIAGLAFIMTPVVLKRSSLGWYDTDPYNLLFPLLLLSITIKAINGKTIKDIVSYAALFALAISGFAAIWQGWGFMLVITMLILSACAGIEILRQRQLISARYYLMLAASFLVASLGGISLLFGFSDFFMLLTEGVKELEKFTVKSMNVWPNLFMEVGELKKASLKDIITDCGGIAFLFASTAAFIYALKKAVATRSKESILNITALSIYLLVCVMLAIPATRFNIFALLGASVFLALGLEAVFVRLDALRKPWIGILCLIITSALITINAQNNIKTSLTPIFNTVWEKALTNIRDNTPAHSIINGWWPPGHFVKGIARRKVMFDGATLGEGPTGYWMANILLSQNEDQAAGLLRMLNISGNKGVEFLKGKGLKTSEAVALLSTIAARSDTEARLLIQAVLNDPKTASELLTLIRGKTPQSYMLLYNELVEQNIGLVFMGRWNIRRIEEINEDPSLLARVPARNSQAYIDFLWKLAGGPSRYSGALNLIAENGNTWTFDENLIVNKSSMKASINSSLYGQGTLTSTVHARDGRVLEAAFADASLRYSVVLYTQDRQLKARLMDRELANSLLIKLFFLDGAGMRHFKPFTSASDATGRTQIKVFEAVWD